MFYPDLEGVKYLAQSYSRVPVATELYMDFHTPISLLSRIRKRSEQYFLLESVEGDEKWARYTFLGFDPRAVFSAKDGKGYYESEEGVLYFEDNPLDFLEGLLRDYKGPKDERLPPLTGGAIGYFGYDAIKYIESIRLNNSDLVQAPDILLMFFDEIIAFDHLKQKIILITNIDTKTNTIESSYQQALDSLKALMSLLNEPILPQMKCCMKVEDFKSNVSKEEFIKQVERAKAYIRRGDIYQVVLSQVLSTSLEADLFAVYRSLRTINPSAYMYLIKFKDLELAGASPETLVRLRGNTVMTQPIAGTRPRGLREDAALIEELLQDEKELAEHNMLVDLGRDDLGRISKLDSIRIKDYKAIRKLSHVIHMTTTVEGLLQDTCSILDIIRAILPAGTLSGAPKLKAIKIIEELESARRGIYGGAICYIGYDGSLDTCIAIRTMIKKGGFAYVQAGAGIVLGSDPLMEYEELMAKASALLRALDAIKDIR